MPCSRCPHAVLRLLATAGGRCSLLVLGLALLLGLPGLAAAADVAFYHSPDDNAQVGDAAVTIEPGVSFELFLYLDGGSQTTSTGEACSDGNGDELCGWNVLVVVPAGMTLETFTPDASGDIISAIDGQEFRANGLDVFSPGTGPVRLGSLQIQASGAGKILLKSGMAAGAALQVRKIARRSVILAVPEPAQAILALAALAVLGLLRRHRSASALLGGALFLCFTATPPSADAAEIILNEYNAVAEGLFFDGGDATTDGDGNTEDLAADSFFGRVAGNNGDWIELVVITPGLDIRGYRLEMEDDNGTAGQLEFSDDLIWSDLAAGTLITIAEEIADDVSYDPKTGDYWIHVQAHAAGNGTYITAADFDVTNRDWSLEILDAGGELVFGPVGERLPDNTYPGFEAPSVNPEEAFRLEADPSAIILPTTSYDDGDDSTFGSENAWGDIQQDFTTLRAVASGPDLDGDGVLDDGDFSGVVGDAPCSGPGDEDCDDNCPLEPNASQTDSGGPDGSVPDGVGDACQCGDISDDGEVAETDLDEIRWQLANPAEVVTAHRKCTGADPDRCDIVAAVRLKRALDDAESAQGFGQMCAAGKQPADLTEYFFNPSRLLGITLIIEPESWDVLRREGWGGTRCSEIGPLPIFSEIQCRFAGLFEAFGQPPPLTSPYNWYLADVEIDGELILNIGARKKGFIGSAFGIRPSFKLDFPEFVGGQRLDGLRRMTLNNNNQDATRVKTCTNYRFLRDIGLPAPRCSLAHIQVNTEDMGIYSSIDPINSGLLARHFGDGNGKLYEGQAADFIPGRTDWFQPKSQAAADDRSEIEALVAAIQIPDPEERLAAIEGIVNVDSFLNLWAGEGIAGLWDGYVASANNYLFYVDPTTGLIEFIPWGADHGLGDQDFTHCTPGNELRTITPRSALALALYESETFRERLIERVEYVAENVWDPELYIAEMERLYSIFGGAPSFLNTMKTWIRGRRAMVRAEIADGPPDISDVPPSCNFIP